MTGLFDSFQRPIDYLRISVTDRCNLRCRYCMPAEGIHLIPHADILSYEEIRSVAAAAAGLGVNKIRITGGEPLDRAGLPELVRMLAQLDGMDDISLTTNGTLLAHHAVELKSAGLRRVNVSLDTLKPNKFKQITRGGRLDEVQQGIEVARSAGLNPLKINVVVIPGVNDDELLDFAARTIHDEWHIRFIEYMPFVESTPAPPVILISAIKQRLAVLGELEPCAVKGNGPAKYFRLPQANGTIGFITPVSEHFCFHCNRLRLTADGKLRPCLLNEEEIDLRQPLRDGISSAELKSLIKKAVARKPLRHRLADGSVPRGRPFSQVGG
ncbi:MAG: GTP 3',8-cyclase MoaA [Dehalococcoidales bacterium]|jgi:cyclic pyranopterin phosphate synthase|nr:GTP 3',8-cyclase MoaA [Dehalococcoidales bacterium]